VMEGMRGTLTAEALDVNIVLFRTTLRIESFKCFLKSRRGLSL
jgi:hypothetical protein